MPSAVQNLGKVPTAHKLIFNKRNNRGSEWETVKDTRGKCPDNSSLPVGQHSGTKLVPKWSFSLAGIYMINFKFCLK